MAFSAGNPDGRGRLAPSRWREGRGEGWPSEAGDVNVAFHTKRIEPVKGAVHNVRRPSPAIPESPWRSRVASIIRPEAESEAQMSEAHES